MPWKEKTVEMNRDEFVKRILAGEKKSPLCREYGISRPTGDKWVTRYLSGESLKNRSRAPFHTPANKISNETEELLVNTRKKYPGIGATKIRHMLSKKGYSDLPCASTVNAVFKRNNLITIEASRAATPHKRFEKESPNIMWQADFKGNYAMGNGQRCYPLSVIDDHSRFCLCADAKPNEQREGVKESFIKVFREYGMPQILLCDNGNPWGASQSSGYTLFEIWLMDLGILTIHIRPRHPQTQGKNERFNRSFKDECLRYYIPCDLPDADRQRAEYRDFYNKERPHHSLDLNVPAQRYRHSERKFVENPKDWEYGSEYETRKIKSSGYISYGGLGYFLSEAFGGKTIAVKQSSKDGFVDLYYRQFKVGSINLKEHAVSRKIYLINGDPRTPGNERPIF